MIASIVHKLGKVTCMTCAVGGKERGREVEVEGLREVGREG